MVLVVAMQHGTASGGASPGGASSAGRQQRSHAVMKSSGCRIFCTTEACLPSQTELHEMYNARQLVCKL